MTTEITTPPEMPEAVADVRNLKARIERKREEIAQLEQRAGDDYKAVAASDDAEVSLQHVDEIARAAAELRALEAMHRTAEAMLERSRNRAYTRARVDIIDDASSRIQALSNEFGPAIEQALNAAIEPLSKFHEAGRQLVALYRSVRGRNTQGRSGVIVSSVVDLNRQEHLQHLVNLHLHRTLGWWRYEMAPPYGSPTFGQAVQGICGAVSNEFDELLGLHDLDPAEVAAVRAEQRARGEPAGLLAGPGGADDIDFSDVADFQH